MRNIIPLVLSIFLGLEAMSCATLTNTTIPVTKNGASNPPTLQNGSITDTGTSSGAGNVGIGSANPGVALDVNGTIRVLGFIQVGSGSTTIVGSNGNVGINSANPGQLLDVSGTIRATGFVGDGSLLTNIVSSQWTGTKPGPIYYSSGNVGIGSANPGQTFDVQGTVRVSTAIQQTGSGGINNFVGNTGINQAAPAQAFDVNGTIKTISISITGSGPSNLGTGGNVGINSATPGQILDVFGTVRALGGYINGSLSVGTTATATTNGLQVLGNVSIGTGTLSSNALTVYMPASNSNVSIGTTAVAVTMLDVQGTIRGTNFLQTSSTANSFAGNIGIGSLSPGQALDVQGTIRMAAVGTTISILSGTNACQGTGTLTSGAQTVNTKCAPATVAGIFLTDTKQNGANLGSIGISTVTSGASFIVESSNSLDTSTYNWLILKSS